MKKTQRIEPNIYRYQTAQGKRFLVRFSWDQHAFKYEGFRTLTLARAYLAKIKGQQIEGRFFPERQQQSKLILNEYAQHFLEICTLRDLKHNTIRSYRDNLTKHILPTFGHLKLSDISRQHITQLLLTKKDAGLSPNAIRLVLAPLSKLLSDAQEAGLIPTNPALHPGRITQTRKRRKRIAPFTLQEEAQILGACERNVPHQYPIPLTLFRSGMRIGEVIALERQDLDLVRCFAVINKNFTNGHLESSSKSGKDRQVDLSDELVIVLKNHLERLDLEASLQRKPPSPLVFPSTQGKFLTARNWIWRFWYPLLDRLFIRRRAPHHCRHTYASRLIEQNSSLAYIRDQLGHSSIQITVDTYGHLVPGTNRQAVNHLDELIRKEKYRTLKIPPP